MDHYRNGPNTWENDVCTECGYVGVPNVSDSLEGADADGNRGRYMRTLECPECGDAVCWYTS